MQNSLYLIAMASVLAATVVLFNPKDDNTISWVTSFTVAAVITIAARSTLQTYEGCGSFWSCESVIEKTE
jgi:hypothetical protein